jgi:myo-inositol 2-dehydrogenase/D-chiro-inositol 1-dehydrogenase
MSAPEDNGFGTSVVDDRFPVRIGVIGAGRIGRLHAELLSREVPGATVGAVADAFPGVANALAVSLGARAVKDVDEILDDPRIDAVAICTSTDTHVDLIVRAAAAGKPIFSEKPISLDLAQVDRAMAAVAAAGVPFMVGFNKRFDPAHALVHDTVRSGELGALHLLRITGRDPAPPPPEYIAVSGGLFLDMTIHDFDMARHISGSEVVQVFATGGVRVDSRIGEAGDVDTAVLVLTHADGVITTIDNSRRAVYGYDQRVEAFCAEGMAFSGNAPRHTGGVLRADGCTAQPLGWSFLDRYREAYRREWAAFTAALRDGTDMPVDAASGRAPIVIALAANRSLAEGRPVATAEVG